MKRPLKKMTWMMMLLAMMAIVGCGAKEEPQVAVGKLIPQDPAGGGMSAEMSAGFEQLQIPPSQGAPISPVPSGEVITVGSGQNAGAETVSDQSVTVQQVSSPDASSSEQPVQETKEQAVTQYAPTIYIDPGHGGDAACKTYYKDQEYDRPKNGGEKDDFPKNALGTTTGTSGGKLTECDVAYDIAIAIRDKLEGIGYKTVMSREDVHTAKAGGGTAIGNWERGYRASKYDAWVVIHADGGGGHGLHCVVYNSDPSFQSTINDTFISYVKDNGALVFTADGYREGQCGNSSGTLQAPSVFVENGGDINKMLYIEAGFMDTDYDLEYMTSKKGMDNIANGVAAALRKVVPIIK